jgi:RHS repeat-associated protein
LKYTGREQDAETGLYYYRARYYDPITGRFLSEDPIRSGINYYTYAYNNPINYNDPTGECPWCIGAAIGGVAGAIQAANSGGGWTWNNAQGIAYGALTGAAFGAIPGFLSASIGLKATMAVGGGSGALGNLANQLLTSDTVDWDQVGTQGLIGIGSGWLGNIAGLQASLGVLRSGGSVTGALNFGNYFGALTGGAAQEKWLRHLEQQPLVFKCNLPSIMLPY